MTLIFVHRTHVKKEEHVHLWEMEASPATAQLEQPATLAVELFLLAVLFLQTIRSDRSLALLKISSFLKFNIHNRSNTFRSRYLRR